MNLLRHLSGDCHEDFVSESMERWSESNAYLKLCVESLHVNNYQQALKWLDQAHNPGRDNVTLHMLAHLSYAKFALRNADIRCVFGHIFWALISQYWCQCNALKEPR
jgi:Protein of unknown function (DUF3703)